MPDTCPLGIFFYAPASRVYRRFENNFKFARGLPIVLRWRLRVAVVRGTKGYAAVRRRVIKAQRWEFIESCFVFKFIVTLTKLGYILAGSARFERRHDQIIIFFFLQFRYYFLRWTFYKGLFKVVLKITIVYLNVPRDGRHWKNCNNFSQNLPELK